MLLQEREQAIEPGGCLAAQRVHRQADGADEGVVSARHLRQKAKEPVHEQSSAPNRAHAQRKF